jgi:hypothetical protein
MRSLRWRLALAGCVALLSTMAPAQDAGTRFDYLVREDMFKGFEGDIEAFDRAMALCERRLASNPDDAEALVWHGAGLMVRAGAAFRAGGREQGIRLTLQATAEMNRAVALKPDSVSVLIPRATSLLGAATHMADSSRRRDYARQAAGDLEKVLALQQAFFAMLAAHPKGELLGALAESWSLVGESDRARGYLVRIADELPGTKYADAARQRLDNSGANPPITCLGCQTSR